MPRPRLSLKPPISPGCATSHFRVLALLMVCSAWVAGCAGSSITSAATNGGGVGVYDSSGGYGYTAQSSDGPGFNPTAASAVHSTAALQAADKLTSVATPGSGRYQIGPLDVLDVSVFKVPDLTKTVQVGEDGQINYPLVGDIKAAGKTSHQLEHELAQRLGGAYIRSPQVTVFVREYNSQRVTVEGSVKNSGVFTVKGRTSLMQLLAMAGGVDDSTASGEVVVFRTINGTSAPT